ncbi:hypothetical protein HPP92_027433 [Vanilla planifolia]|uniref:PHD-type zinc finger plants domain-containing protein n=1 Tax=Vanilla planifolia TaxID=51239 RepID=A0A835PF95_VANPL|nr:hypothetical protein HPP92_027433 [Vanilla planifolia]
MADGNSTCCLCGDVGFPDKLFRCLRCLHRTQHSYCSNFYRDDASKTPATSVCDWCLSEEQRPTHFSGSGRFGSEKAATRTGGDQESSGGKGRTTPGGTSSSAKHTGRRYKLLKDVLC